MCMRENISIFRRHESCANAGLDLVALQRQSDATQAYGRKIDAARQQVELPEPYSVSVGGILLHINPERWRQGKDKLPAIRYRISHWMGSKRLSIILHNPETVLKEARAWGKSLNTEGHTRSTALFQEQRRRSILYGECEDILASYSVDPIRACRITAGLLETAGIEGAEKLIAVYAPLVRKCHPLFVSKGVEEYRKVLFKTGELKTKDQERKDKCLKLFADRFGGTQLLFITADQIKAFLQGATQGKDMRNKYLYCLRSLFNWARDDKQALPARIETECDIVNGRKPEKPEPEIYPVRAFAWLAGLAVDREMVLALALAGQHFLRQAEVERLRGEDFHRDPTGMPFEIIVREAVAKTRQRRPIPIEPPFRPLFKALAPPKGPLFHTTKPFDRVERLARALGITKIKNGFRHSCISYAISAGMTREEAASRAGHDQQTQGSFYFVLVDAREARKYRRITFNLPRAVQLPLYRRVNFRKLASRYTSRAT